MIFLAEKHSCTGCSSCTNICNHNAINMLADEEGFLQPQIDRDKCVECGLCTKSCPILSPRHYRYLNKKEQIAYALISYKDRTLSSSGGAFSVFARYVLSEGGTIYGAIIDDKFNVYHIRAINMEEIAKIRGSKYVQSSLRYSYRLVKEDLKAGLKVLFTGTPCQVAGLYAYLGKNKYQTQLITLDLVCHGVPSQGYFKSYLKKLETTTGHKLKAFRFRKLDSWSIVPAIQFAETERWRNLEQEKNAFMTAFFNKSIFRECCYQCHYSNMNRVGTFTIADYWGIGSQGIPFKKNIAAGVSLVIDNQGMMPNLITHLEKYAYIEERPLEECKAKNHNLNAPSERPEERDGAVKDMLDKNMTLRNYAEKFHLIKKENLQYYLLKWTKDIIYALRIYNVYKTISYKLGKTS